MPLPWYTRSLVVLFLHYTLLLAQCPPLGPIVPAPSGLSQDPTFQELVAQINAQFQNTTTSLNQTAVSIGMRSVHETMPLLNFHHTPSNYNTSGTDNVDGNTVYRVGSTTKLFVALSILQLEGKIHLSDPVTKYVPRLKDLSGSDNSLAKVDWKTVTIHALLSQLGGAPVDITGNAIQDIPGLAQAMGLPPSPLSQKSVACGGAPGQPPCSWDVFFDNVDKRAPVYPASTTPVYSNIGFAVLGRIVENVSGQTFAKYLEQNVFKQAGMNRTSMAAPTNNLGFIPAESNWWGTSLGWKDLEGGLYASNNDLLSFGTAILSNKFLGPARTRAWMKPTAFTSSMGMAVGHAWEIVRGPNLTADGRVIDFYAKTGDVGDYSAFLVLVPDFDLVIAMNFAGPEVDSAASLVVFSQLVAALVPVVDQIGKGEASQKLAGTFAANKNSSLVLSVDESGVLVSNFTANGVDVARGYSALSNAGGVQTTIRLYPTGLRDGKKSAWRSVYTTGTAADAAAIDELLFFPQGSCQTWLRLDRVQYGLESIDYFVLTEDDTGKVTAVEPKAWGLGLERAD